MRISVLMIFFVYCISGPLLNAQRTRPEPVSEETIDDAFIQAKLDAQEDVSKVQWFGCGFIGLVYGVGAAYLWGRSPDQARFMGKSSDYIYTYTKEYRSKVRSIRTKYALLGCGVSGAILMVGMIIALSTTECDPSCGLTDNTCLTDENCSTAEGCSSGDNGCGSSSSSTSCGGSADYLVQ